MPSRPEQARRPRASILLFSLVVMAILLVLITLALSSTSTGTRTHQTRHASDQAFYLAEAGRQRAITTLAATGAWAHDGQAFSLGAGTYAVTATGEPLSPEVTRWTLTCSGTVALQDDAMTATVVQQVDVQVAGPGPNEGTVLDLSLVADSWRRP